MANNDLETSGVPLSVLFCIVDKAYYSECRDNKSYSNQHIVGCLNISKDFFNIALGQPMEFVNFVV